MLSPSPSKIHEPRVTGVSPRTSDSARKLRNTRAPRHRAPATSAGTTWSGGPRSLNGQTGQLFGRRVPTWQPVTDRVEGPWQEGRRPLPGYAYRGQDQRRHKTPDSRGGL